MDIEYNFRKDLVKLMTLFYGDYTRFSTFEGWLSIEKDIVRTLTVWKLAGKMGNSESFLDEYKDLMFRYARLFNKDTPMPIEYYTLLNIMDKKTGYELINSKLLEKYTKLILRSANDCFFSSDLFTTFCCDIACIGDGNLYTGRYFENVTEIDASDFKDYTCKSNLKNKGIFSHFKNLKNIRVSSDIMSENRCLVNSFSGNTVLKNIEFANNTNFYPFMRFTRTFSGCRSLDELGLSKVGIRSDFRNAFMDVAIRHLVLDFYSDIPEVFRHTDGYRTTTNMRGIFNSALLEYVEINNDSEAYIEFGFISVGSSLSANPQKKLVIKYTDTKPHIDVMFLWKTTLNANYPEVNYILPKRLEADFAEIVKEETGRTDCIRTFEFI